MTTEPTLTPPFDLDAERAVLGSALLDRDAIVAMAPLLRPEHFYLEKHARIYTAMLACYDRREPPDLATVAAELRRTEDLHLVGGLGFLAELATAVPTAVHAEYYARIVEEAAVGRALIEAGGQVAALGFDARRPIADRLSEAAHTVYQVAVGRQLGQDFVPLTLVASEYLEAAQTAEDEDGELLGLGTGYRDLDAITQGLKRGELIVLAARPGVGKTSMALSIAYRVAQRGHRVGIFSMEMDRDALLQRLLAMETGISGGTIARRLRAGDQRAIDALARVASLPIHIDHTPALNVLAMRDRARRLTTDGAVDLWVVDYLQMAQGVSERDDEVRRITAVSQGLTTLAREFRAPVLALSQLSRAVESRADHVPMLSDLRGSGSIEQDASQVWFIYRDELYNDETEHTGIAEIHVSKHRNGATGVASLRFEPATTSFHNLRSYTPPQGY